MITEQDQHEDPEYGLDSRYQSEEEKNSEAVLLMEARLDKMKNLSHGDIAAAKLMQLKLQMDEYLTRPLCEEKGYFLSFLKSYIDIIYKRKSSFASDMDINATRLSQIVNQHREPSTEFFRRLMIHSEKIYERICNFDPKIWYELYYQENLCRMMADQDHWRPQVEEHVTVSEPVSPSYGKKK